MTIRTTLASTKGFRRIIGMAGSQRKKQASLIALALAGAVWAGGVPAMFGFAPPPATARESDLDRLNDLIRTLAQEAKTALDSGELPRRRADIARTSKQTIDAALIGRRIVEPLDRNPFVDAYIRWQLTSFSPELPDLRERDFEELLKKMPAYPENPRADRRLLDTLNRAVAVTSRRQGGLLTEAEAEQLSAMLNESSAAESTARQRMRPANEFRDWLEKAIGELGPRAHLVRLERLAALLRAGWDVEREKRELERAFREAAQDPTLTAADRDRLLALARRLAGTRRGYVQRAAIVEGRIEFTANETAVYDFEINAWARALAGKS